MTTTTDKKKKTTKKKTTTEIKKPAFVKKEPITDVLVSNYMPYAMSVIVSRAIPEIDGFKPAHRKLLYTMYKMGLLNGKKTKSANIVGQTMKLNPHGDQTIYETMVRLTRGNESLLYPFVDSKGNFGKQYSKDMAYAAPRYTEAKLDKFCEEIFKDIDKNTVDLVDNYDGSLKEPTLLPTTFPNILVNPNQGIAVGMASNICSFNLKEICDATILMLKNKKFNIADVITVPDLPSGGEIIYNRELFENIYATGSGSFYIRSKYRYDKKNNCIEVYQIPYESSIEAISNKIIKLVKENKIKEISDIRDETDLNGLKFTIDIKKDVDADTLMNKLFLMTPLQEAFSCNFRLLINGEPKLLGIKDILNEWIVFRVNCVKRGFEFDLNKKQEKLHLLQGLEKILLNIDKAIKIIRNSQTDNEVIENLMKVFKIDNIQAEYIADIKLRNLNKDYILNKTKEIALLEKEIDNLINMLSDDKKIKNHIAKELAIISNKYNKERKSTIINESEIKEIKIEEKIDSYSFSGVLLNSNYFKKIKNLTEDKQLLKDNDDFVLYEFTGKNEDDMLFFTNLGNVYKQKACDLPVNTNKEIGVYLPNLLNSEKEEKITYACSTSNYDGFIIFCFENGKIAKIDAKAYETKTNRKKLVNGISTNSKLIKAFYLQNDKTLSFSLSNGKIKKIQTKNILLKTTKGNQGTQFVQVSEKIKIEDINLL